MITSSHADALFTSLEGGRTNQFHVLAVERVEYGYNIETRALHLAGTPHDRFVFTGVWDVRKAAPTIGLSIVLHDVLEADCDRVVAAIAHHYVEKGMDRRINYNLDPCDGELALAVAYTPEVVRGEDAETQLVRLVPDIMHGLENIMREWYSLADAIYRGLRMDAREPAAAYMYN